MANARPQITKRGDIPDFAPLHQSPINANEIDPSASPCGRHGSYNTVSSTDLDMDPVTAEEVSRLYSGEQELIQSPRPRKSIEEVIRPQKSADAVVVKNTRSIIANSLASDLAKRYVTSATSHDELSFSTVIEIITDTVQFVEEYNTMKGPERKEVVIEAVISYIQIAVDNTSWRRQLVGFVELVGPGIIDMIVLASKGDLNINKKSVRKWLSKWTCGCVAPHTTTSA